MEKGSKNLLLKKCIKAGNISYNLQNEVGQIMYSMYGAKGVTKKYTTI